MTMIGDIEIDEDELEEEFLQFKYKKYCETHNKIYSPHYKIPDWFGEWVWDGENEDELEYLDYERDTDSWYL